jgi:phosphate:acyl-[acyl carrier protein] acyltransferase
MEIVMSDTIRIAIDTIGGDNGSEFFVKAAVQETNNNPDLKIILTGHEDELCDYLDAEEYDKDRIEVINTEEEISLHEKPVEAVRKKKDSSLVVAMNLVKEGKADAVISAGSSGAVLAGGLFIVGKPKCVKRAPLATLVPTTGAPSLLLDCGANVDAKPEVLVQFAKMGYIYMESVVGVENPKVAIVNIGAEEEKGNALVKETIPLLKECKDINFIGCIESREIPFGKADVILTEAFVGNVIVKFYEGVAKMILGEVKGAIKSSSRGKIGGLLVKKPLLKMKSKFSASNKGGAPLLGLNGLVVKIHGNSKEEEVISAIEQCTAFIENDVSGKIVRGIEETSNVR